jgi:hypothetical protein
MLTMLVPITKLSVAASNSPAWARSCGSPLIHRVGKPIPSISRAMASVVKWDGCHTPKLPRCMPSMMARQKWTGKSSFGGRI